MRDLYVDLVTHGPLYASYGEWTSDYTDRAGGHELVIVGVDLGSNRVYVNNPWGVSGSQSQSDFLYDFYDGSYTHDHTEYVSGVGTVHWEFDCYTHLDD